MLRYTYTSGSLYCCTSGHVTLSKITLSHHGVGVDIITFTPSEIMFQTPSENLVNRGYVDKKWNSPQACKP